MKRESIALLSLTFAASGLLLAPSAAQAAPSSCNGLPVTIVADFRTVQGTEGDDVVAMEPGQWAKFDALGGNDTICFTAGLRSGSSPSDSPSQVVDAGAGNDTVINLSQPGPKYLKTRVVLGLGSDTYVGSGIGEEVQAETLVNELTDYAAIDPALVGEQTDTITGAAQVYSTAPSDGPNRDRISLAGSNATAYMTGALSPDGLLDFTAAQRATLQLRAPGRLDPAAADIKIDAAARTISGATGTVLAWQGNVRSYEIFSNFPPSPSKSTVSFTGSDLAEEVWFDSVPAGDVRTEGGNDNVIIDGGTPPVSPRLVDGGPGRDRANYTLDCRELRVVRDQTMRCDASVGGLTGVEVLSASNDHGQGRTTMIGTDAADTLEADGQEVLINSGGGADKVVVSSAERARINAGAGPDKVKADSHRVVIRGGPGADRITLDGIPEFSNSYSKPQEVFGGPGPDTLIGQPFNAHERLIGGPGRDVADGRKGRNDYCLAEVRRNCELPRSSSAAQDLEAQK